MKRLFAPLALALTAGLSASAQAQIIAQETFNDGLAAGRWTVVSTEEVNTFTNEETGVVTQIAAPPDFRATFNFDYSILNLIPGFVGIPQAPNNPSGDTSTVGAYFQSNLVNFTPETFTNRVLDPDTGLFVDQEETIFEGAGVGALFNGLTLPENFSLKADMYYAELGVGGSTEWSAIGVHHQGSSETPVPFVGNGDGLAWSTSTDTDTSFNLRGYDAPPGGPSSSSNASVFGRRYSEVPDGTIPGVPTGTADPSGIMNQWVTFEVTRENGTVKWFINGTLIDVSPGAAYSGGTVLIGNSDAFDSIAPAYEQVNANAFVGTPFQAQFLQFVASIPSGLTITNGAIFDNIVVTEIPEPSAVVLIGLGLAAVAGLRRRSR